MTALISLYVQVKLGDVFKMDFASARQLIQETSQVLSKWSSEYFSVRKRIEDSGSDHR